MWGNVAGFWQEARPDPVLTLALIDKHVREVLLDYIAAVQIIDVAPLPQPVCRDPDDDVVLVRVHGVQRRRLTQLQADGDGCAPRGRGRPSAGRHGGQRSRKQARRRGVGDGREHGFVHELPQVHPLAQAGLMNAEATRQELVAAQ